MLLVYFVIAALPIGYLVGGSLSNIRFARLRFVMLPCAAFLVEASIGVIGKLLDAPPSEWLGKVVCLEYMLLTAFIWINHRMRGMDMLGAATLVNFAVIAANGFRMPVTPIIYEHPELYHFVERIQTGSLPEYVLVDWNGPLWFLGDTIPLGTGLASIGDLLMALGVMIIVIDMMKTKPPMRRRRNKYRRRDYDWDDYYEDRYDHRRRHHHKRTRWS
ncbi:MAG: DUF5317 family protein [Clostridia bacterium]|nr:DUF5317 family protein [Clostridia bacterium]MBP3653264.1 DUF5317 family protein [Clostridia bacterium]